MLTWAVGMGCLSFPSQCAINHTYTYLQCISKKDNKVLQIQHKVRVVTVWLRRQRSVSERCHSCGSISILHKCVLCSRVWEFVFRLRVSLQSASSGRRWFWTAPTPKAPPRTLYSPNPAWCEGRDPPQQRSWMEGRQQRRENSWYTKTKRHCSSARLSLRQVQGLPEVLPSPYIRNTKCVYITSYDVLWYIDGLYNILSATADFGA